MNSLGSISQTTDSVVVDNAHGSSNTTNHLDSQSASHSQPTLDPHGRILNPRSCVTCRRRKVKCDKLHPCSNCSRAHIDCIFPTPGRAPRKIKKNTDGRDVELLARLRRLEGVVKGLGVDVDLDTSTGPNDVPTATLSQDARRRLMQRKRRERRSRGSGDDLLAQDDQEVDMSDNGSEQDGGEIGQEPVQSEPLQDPSATAPEPRLGTSGSVENRFGRLVINEGRSRYVNNSFWASLSNEVEDLKGILNEDSDDDEDQMSPASQTHQSGQHHGWIFGFSSTSIDLLGMHPIPRQIEMYWKTYKERVDPLVKVLHIPSIEPTILTATSHLTNLAKGFEALLFAIYYGVATSLSPEECRVQLGEEKGVLLSRYRFAVEQALARANFLITEELVVLQAFVIFLMCLRRNSDARVIWTLTGLLVRMAQTVGIHRDGSHFGLRPFDVEMRRRLWWQVCILEGRALEDHGCDPTISEQQFDTKLPLNVNDSDLKPTMVHFPQERQSCTEMSFCLVRFEVANTFRKIHYAPPGPASGNRIQDKERWITECHQRLEDKYLKHCDMTVPIFWVTATVTRLMMSKMWLMIYHPFQRHDGGATLDETVKDKLFITSLENIEYSLLLETEARTMKWGWLFKTYVQWHALAFIMSELCHRTRGELVERAWIAVVKTYDGRWGELTDDGRRGYLWKPLNRLMAKAKAAREQAMMEDGLSTTQQKWPKQENFLPGSTAELLQQTSQRPKLVSAPLSRAQLSRFMAPTPAFGTQPIDSTKLLQSPVIGKKGSVELDEDAMDASWSLPSEVPETSRHSHDWPVIPNDPHNRSGIRASSGMTSNQPWPDETVSESKTLPRASDTEMFASTTSNMPSVSNEMEDVSRNTSTADMSMYFDANGDIDWARWDQMVQQFGMDNAVDPTVNSLGPATGRQGSNWNQFGVGGVGMGGTDWF